MLNTVLSRLLLMLLLLLLSKFVAGLITGRRWKKGIFFFFASSCWLFGTLVAGRITGSSSSLSSPVWRETLNEKQYFKTIVSPTFGKFLYLTAVEVGGGRPKWGVDTSSPSPSLPIEPEMRTLLEKNKLITPKIVLVWDTQGMFGKSLASYLAPPAASSALILW